MEKTAKKRTGETTAHRELKALCLTWAKANGYAVAKTEVTFPYRGMRVDVAACTPLLKAPPRGINAMPNQILKSTAIFEAKQCKADLVRDNFHRATLRDRVKALIARKDALEEKLRFHSPHTAYGEALWPEYDCYRLTDIGHKGYTKLIADVRRAQARITDATKFDRLTQYKLANLHYLVAEPDLVSIEEVPVHWGLLVRQGEELVQIRKPTWQDIDLIAQLFFLKRVAYAKG